MHGLGVTLAAAAILLLVLFGIAGVGRSGARALIDFDFYYAAGRCWLSGRSMYDPVAFTTELRAIGHDVPELSFGYSPAFVPFAMALAALPYATARSAMWGFNLVGVALLCWLAIRLARDTERMSGARTSAATPWVLICVVAGLPCTAHVLWLGQITVWMVALTCAGWLALRERRTVLAGVLLGLTSVKPQFSLFLFLWLALNREWTVIFTAGITALALSVYAMIRLGPFEPFVQFLTGVSRYTGVGPGVNALGNVHVLGLPSLLTALGVNGLSLAVFVAVTSVGVVAVWLTRRRLRAEGVLALLMTAQLALVYAHDIELVFLVPTWTWLWVRFGAQSKLAVVSLALMLLLSTPKRLITADTSGMLLHWRSMTLLALLVLVVASSFVKTARQDDSTSPRTR